VCSNGYGHLKRDIAVISSILNQNSTIGVDVFCKSEHIKMARREINFNHGSQLNFHDDATKNEINWLKEETITSVQYDAWTEELKHHSILQKADLIVSDNHVLPLRVFPQTKLMGSFLWHDVNVVWNETTKRIAQEEHELIDIHRPDMLCLSGMAMPEVLNFTNPIKLPWYCTKYSQNNFSGNEEGILVTGGGTDLIKEFLVEFILKLNLLSPELKIYIDSKLDMLIGSNRNQNIEKFTFTFEAFSTLSAIVCRPGIGILTDCVRYNLPVIVINDGYNSEINNNALRVKELGIGISFESKLSMDIIVNETKHFLANKSQIDYCRNQLSNQQTDGAEIAAKYLINALI